MGLILHSNVQKMVASGQNINGCYAVAMGLMLL